ncbi:MAG: hypothetical protein ACR2NP_20465 [Pirellulaceae bacterium]
MPESDQQLGLAFVIVSDVKQPESAPIIAAAKEMGIGLALSEDRETEENEDQPEIDTYDIDGGGSLMVTLMPGPHPDVAEMAGGPLSPDDMDVLINAPAHCIVTAIGLEGTIDEIDIRMSGLTAAVLNGCHAVGVLKMPGVLFHRPELYTECAKRGVDENELPMLICVDITAAREGPSEMSFLTHNLPRYGREDLYITCSTEGEGAFDFVLDMIGWLLSDRDYQLPTGDTIGRNADEKIKINRVASPLGEGPEVIHLEFV